jgi:hypothetical protein
MATVTSTTANYEKIDSLYASNNLNQNFFEEKEASESLIRIKVGPSIKTPASQRIGTKVIRITDTVKNVVEDTSVDASQTSIKGITVFTEDGQECGDCLIGSFIQGANVTQIIDNGCSLLPHLTINSPNPTTEKGTINNTFENIIYGQLDSFNFSMLDNKTQKFLPFRDIPKFDPVSFIKCWPTSGYQFQGYVIVNDGLTDLKQALNPDASRLQGAIEVFNIRNQLVNTNISDIDTKGAKGDFSSGNISIERSKGSQIIDNRIEFKQSNYDWYEDSQDAIMGYSIDGYISEGTYGIAPFNDLHVIDDKKFYKHLNSTQKNSLLIKSNRDISEIGTRFKSQQNGFIINPNYSSVTHTVRTVLGTDSIVYRGLIKG